MGVRACEALNLMRRACSADSRHDSCVADLALVAGPCINLKERLRICAQPVEGRTCRPSLGVVAQPPILYSSTMFDLIRNALMCLERSLRLPEAMHVAEDVLDPSLLWCAQG